MLSWAAVRERAKFVRVGEEEEYGDLGGLGCRREREKTAVAGRVV